jgi:epoxide hydrolase-like predicted phosphatase
MPATNRNPRRFEVALFDFGGVFIESPFPAFRETCRRKGLDGERLIELTFGPLDRDTDHPWHRIERGEVSMLDARLEILELIRAAGLDIDPFVLLAKSLLPQKEGHPVVLESVRHLRHAGVKVGLVTNNAIEIRERWRSLLPLEELFDDVVDSSEVGVRKPDPAIYTLALERLGGVPAEAAIFLDDLRENLAAAEALGMRGILVAPDPAPAMEQLRALVDG